MSHNNAMDDDGSLLAFFLSPFFYSRVAHLRITCPPTEKRRENRLKTAFGWSDTARKCSRKHIPLCTCIIYIVFKSVIKKLNWIELNRFQSNNVISCFLCLLFFPFHWFSLDTLVHLLLLWPLINIESLRIFRIEQKNNGTEKYQWHLKRKSADAWTMYAYERSQSIQIHSVAWNPSKPMNKKRAYVGPKRWPTYYWFILLF